MWGSDRGCTSMTRAAWFRQARRVAFLELHLRRGVEPVPLCGDSARQRTPGPVTLRPRGRIRHREPLENTMKYLALTVSGAVSLGAYEAGVLYEVLHALKAHNSKAKNDDGRIKIDVITGASAGGMSAAILAQKLLLSAPDLDGFDTNVL